MASRSAGPALLLAALLAGSGLIVGVGLLAAFGVVLYMKINETEPVVPADQRLERGLVLLPEEPGE